MKIYTIKITTVAAALLFVLSFLGQKSFGQTTELHAEEHEEKGAKLTIAMGHAHVHEGVENGDKKWLIMGSWAMNLDYVFTNHWALGIHNDLILEDFAVEEHLNDEESMILERSRPFATKLVGTYKPGKHMGFMVGIGDEITKDKNLFLSTVGVDYGVHIAKGWELVGELTYDVKWKSYDTWILGFGVSKFIGGHHHHPKHKS